MCEFTLIITNLKLEVLTSLEIIQLYRLRWQIEIMFKCWKSILDFGKVHPMKGQRFLCMLYGHMIWIILTMKLVSLFRTICWNGYQMELSELKFFKIVYQIQHKIWEAIHNNHRKKLRTIMEKLAKTVFLYAEKEVKKNRVNLPFNPL